MTDLPEVQVEAILLSQIETWANTASLPVDWQGRIFTPPEASPWLRARVMFSEPGARTVGVGGTDTLRGVVMCNVFVRPNIPAYAGTSPLRRLATALAAVFYRGASFAGDGMFVRIGKRPYVGDVADGTDRVGVPVSVFWYADVQSFTGG